MMNTQDPTTPINNHLVGAILCTLFCCLPFGIVAIINASQVNTQIALGNIEAAKIYADKAKDWIKWSILTGIIVGVLALAFQLVIGGLTYSETYEINLDSSGEVAQ